MDPSQLEIDEWSLCQNSFEDGAKYVKRGGTRRQGTPIGGATVRALHIGYHTTTANLKPRFAVCGASVYQLVSSTWTALTSIGSLATTGYPDIFSYQNTVYGAEGNWSKSWPIQSTLATASDSTPVSGEVVKNQCLYLNRRYFNIKSNPHELFWTELGQATTVGASNFYTVPDDQAGLAPVAIKACSEGVALFCPNFVLNLTGAGPSQHSFKRFPRDAALLSPRAIVDCGRFFVFMTTEGPMVWDLWQQPRLLDPDRKVNWHDMKVTTPELMFGIRHGRKIRWYWPSRGTVETIGDARTRTIALVKSVASMLLFRTGSVATIKAGSSYTNKYYEWDMERNRVTGPHDGAHLCGFEDEPAYGDQGDLWLGSSQADGKIWTGDDILYSDDHDGTATNGTMYEVRFRTGCFGLNPFRNYRFHKLRMYHGIQGNPGGKCRVELYFHLEKEPRWKRDVVLTAEGSVGGEEGGIEDQLSQEFAKKLHVDVWGSGMIAPDEKVVGILPQIGVVENSFQNFTLHGLEPWFSEVEMSVE